MHPTLALIFTLSFAAGQKHEFELPHDGFVVLHSLSLTPGKICRKLERKKADVPLAWHLQTSWNSIQLESVDATDDAKFSGACQAALRQSTLIGPLQKGTWKVFGAASVAVDKIQPFTRRLDIKPEGKTYSFTTDSTAILKVDAGRMGNTTGECREYLPLKLSIVSGEKTSEIRAEILAPQSRSPRGALCRALPQTLAYGAIEIPAGSYRLENRDLTRVTLFARP